MQQPMRITYPIAECFPVAPEWLKEHIEAVGCPIYWRDGSEGPATHVVIKADGVFLANVNTIVAAESGHAQWDPLEGITVQDLGNREYRIFQDDKPATFQFDINDKMAVEDPIVVTSGDMKKAGFTLLASQKEYNINENQQLTFNGAPIGTLDDQPDADTGAFRIQGGALQVWDKFGLVRFEENKDSLPVGSPWMQRVIATLLVAIVVSAVGFVLVPRTKMLYPVKS